MKLSPIKQLLLLISAVSVLGGVSVLPCQAQQEVSVDQFMGTAHVSIPLCTPGIKAVSIPLGLHYVAAGVKVNDIGANGDAANNLGVGLGWELSGVPVVTREVRGLPDDVLTTNTNPNILSVPGFGLVNGPRGWLSSTVASANRTNGFVQPATGTCPAPCPVAEAAALAALAVVHPLNPASNTNPILDTEPDVFSYSFPDHAGKFVLTREAGAGSSTQIVAHTIPYDPISIVFQPAYISYGVIKPGKLTIKTPEGLTYYFGDEGYADITVKTIEYLDTNTGGSTIINRAEPPRFFRKEYDYLKNPSSNITVTSMYRIAYATAWHVSQVASPDENIDFAYADLPFDPTKDFTQTSYDMSVETNPANQNHVLAGDGKAQLRWYLDGTTRRILTGISTPTQTVSFQSDGNQTSLGQGKLLTGIIVTSKVATVDKYIMGYSFSYQHIQSDGFAVTAYDSNGYLDPYGSIPWQDNHYFNEIAVEDKHRRHFLVAVAASEHCAERPGYQFTYHGLDVRKSTWLFPPPGSLQHDAWGFAKYFDPNTADGAGYPRIYIYPDLITQQVPGAPYRLFPISNSILPYGINNLTIPGADRRPHTNQTDFENHTLSGTLERIALPTGGTCKLSYEPHYFFDSTAITSSYAGGGTRIRELRFRDHVNGVEEVRTYEYLDPISSDPNRSSGRILHMPRFVFAAPTANPSLDPGYISTWATAAVRSLDDLSHDPFESTSVGYRRVSEIVTGRGRTTTTYAVTGNPETGQLGTGSLWHRSRVQLANHASTGQNPITLSSSPFINGFNPGYDLYPFAPASNLDFRRGLPLRVVLEAATTVGSAPAYAPIQQTDFVYAFSRPVEPVIGVSYDLLNWGRTNYYTSGGSTSSSPQCTDCVIFAYAPYQLNTNFVYQLKEKTETTFDLAAGSSATPVTQYSRYGYNANGMLASTASRRGNGDWYRTRYKYLGDYPYSSAAAPYGPMLNAQLKRHFEGRDNDLVETISEIITSAATPVRRITSASLTTFKEEALAPMQTVGRTRPYQTWSWQAAPGLTPPADTVALASAGGVWELNRSSRFRWTSSVEQVSDHLVPLSVEMSNGRQRSGIHLGYQQTLPVLQIANALADEVVFSNFESSTDARDARHTFELIGEARGVTEAHTGQRCISLSNTTQLVKATIPTTPTSPLAIIPVAYRLSLWANPGVTASLAVSLSNATASTWTRTIDLGAEAVGKWRRYELLIPATEYSNARQLRLKLASGLAAGAAVNLDDVLLLPAHATAQSTAYQLPIGKTAEVDAGGRTTYFDYDQAGQLRQVRDHNKAIVRRVEQAPWGQVVAEGPPAQIILQAASNIITSGGSGQFTVLGLCTTTSYSIDWSFGDGASTTGSESSISHTFPVILSAYASYHSYTVTAVLHTLQGIRTGQVVVNVMDEPVPFVVSICRAGIVQYEINPSPSYPQFSPGSDPDCSLTGVPANVTRYTVSIPSIHQPGVSYHWYRQEDPSSTRVPIPPTPNGTFYNPNPPGPGYIQVNGQVLDVAMPNGYSEDPPSCIYICDVVSNSGTGSVFSHPDWYYDGRLLLGPTPVGQIIKQAIK